MTMAAVEVRGSYEIETGHLQAVRFAMGQCPACDMPLVLRFDTMGNDGERAYLDDIPSVVYPVEAGADPAWPKKVGKRYAEADACIRARAYNAAAVMCRRTMEQVCLELGVQEKTLVKSLEKLKAQGLLDETLVDWAHSLRAVGNVGAHAGSEDVDRQDAYDVVEFARAVIDYVFTYKRRFEAFKARRPATKAAATPAGDAE